MSKPCVIAVQFLFFWVFHCSNLELSCSITNLNTNLRDNLDSNCYNCLWFANLKDGPNIHLLLGMKIFVTCICFFNSISLLLSFFLFILFFYFMILAPTTYSFFASALPVIAFSEQPCVNCQQPLVIFGWCEDKR